LVVEPPKPPDIPFLSGRIPKTQLKCSGQNHLEKEYGINIKNYSYKIEATDS
jgi:hypothetical protein